MKEYYCKSDGCKHFYTRGCYDVVNNELPTCATVKRCVEDKADKFPDMAEKWHTAHVKMNSGVASMVSGISFITVGLTFALFVNL